MHLGADPEDNHKVMMSARVKYARKVDSMETNVAEPLAVPEKKMRRADCVPLVESGAGRLNEMNDSLMRLALRGALRIIRIPRSEIKG